MKILRPTRISRCIGCESCSQACARLKHKAISWNATGIRINSSGGLSTGFEARVCVACDPAPCAVACPTGAYEQRPGGGVKVHEELCIRCGECAKACPFDAIALDPENNFPYVCVHCALCVAFCPHDCLEMVDLEPRGTGSNLEETRHVA